MLDWRVGLGAAVLAMIVVGAEQQRERARLRSKLGRSQIEGADIPPVAPWAFLFQPGQERLEFTLCQTDGQPGFKRPIVCRNVACGLTMLPSRIGKGVQNSEPGELRVEIGAHGLAVRTRGAIRAYRS